MGVAMALLQALLILLGAAFERSEGHAWLQQPPGRSSAWRFGFPTPKNFNDNGLNCGGRTTQHNTYGGKCGLCGDPYGGPRLHEPGPSNAYAMGVIVANYTQGQCVNIAVKVTAPHKGYHEFRLFKNNVPQVGKDASVAVPSESSSVLLTSPDGHTRFDELDPAIVVKLPADVTCDACILQWRWRTGNSWGCDDDVCGIGYGPQEEFYGCADVRIAPASGGSNSGSPSPAATASPVATRTIVNVMPTAKAWASATRTTATVAPEKPTAPSSTIATSRAAGWSSSTATSAPATQPRHWATASTSGAAAATSITAATTTYGIGTKRVALSSSSPPASAPTKEVADAATTATPGGLTTRRTTGNLATTIGAATFSWPRLWDCSGRAPFGDQMKQWCESNCNRIPSYCPQTHCICVRL